MLSSWWNVSKLIDIVYLFMINHDIKGQSSMSSFREMTNKFRKCSVFDEMFPNLKTYCIFLWLIMVSKTNSLGPVLRKWTKVVGGSLDFNISINKCDLNYNLIPLTGLELHFMWHTEYKRTVLPIRLSQKVVLYNYWPEWILKRTKTLNMILKKNPHTGDTESLDRCGS